MADLKKRRLGPTELTLVQMANSLEDAKSNMQECFWKYTCQVSFEIGFGQHPLTKTMYMSAKHELDALGQAEEIALADLGERALDAKVITAHITMYSLENKTFSKAIVHLTYDKEYKTWVLGSDINDTLNDVERIHTRRYGKLGYGAQEARQ